MQSYRNSNSHNINLVKDLLGVLLALVIGIGGLIIVTDPIKTLFPKHPMISSQDWSGSHVTGRTEIRTNNWEEYRILSIILRSENDASGHDAQIHQEARWYADMADAADFWNHSSPYPKSQLISENFISVDKPASRLYCDGTSCDFEAYRGHWYTQIFFWSESDELLSLSDIQQIVTRANQLLMSVSDEQAITALQNQSNPTSLPQVIILPTARTTESTLPVTTQNPLDQSAPPGFAIPTSTSTISCVPLQNGETRIVSAGTFIIGDVIIDGVEQSDPNITNEGKIAYLEKTSIVTAPQGADCYVGNNNSIYQVVQNELQYGCGSKCQSVRFVLVQSDGQHVKIFK